MLVSKYVVVIFLYFQQSKHIKWLTGRKGWQSNLLLYLEFTIRLYQKKKKKVKTRVRLLLVL